MHDWGDDKVDWKGIGDSAEYIATNLVRWGLVNVRDWKEKFGTVRIYCSLGWYQFHSITHPRHVWGRYPKWLWALDCKYGSKIVRPLNWIVIPYHKWLYRRLYRNAVRKWPHLMEEILSAADFDELLVDVTPEWRMRCEARRAMKEDMDYLMRRIRELEHEVVHLKKHAPYEVLDVD